MAERQYSDWELWDYRILKIWKKYMVQKKWMRITPTSYWSLVPAWANVFEMPVDLDTAKAWIELKKWNWKVIYQD